MPLLSIITLNRPICIIHEFLYGCNITFLSMDLFKNQQFWCLGRTPWMFKWIISCPCFQHLFNTCMFSLFLYFVLSFAIITDLTLSKLKTLNLTVSKVSCWHCCLFHVIVYLVNCFYFPLATSLVTCLLTLMQTLSKWLLINTLQFLLYTGHLWGSHIILQYLHFFQFLTIFFLCYYCHCHVCLTLSYQNLCFLCCIWHSFLSSLCFDHLYHS